MSVWPPIRYRPAWSVTVSPEAAEFVEGLLADWPADFRSRSAAVDRCILVARDWSRVQAARQVARGVVDSEP